MIIKNKKISEFIFNPIKVKDLYKKDNQSISFAEIKLSGVNKKQKNTVSELYYYIVKGSGKFIIKNSEYSVETGDLVIISKNTPYYDIGEMKMIAISIPAFNQNNVEFIK